MAHPLIFTMLLTTYLLYRTEKLKYISPRIHPYEYNKTSHTCIVSQNSLYYKTSPQTTTKTLYLTSELEHCSKNNSGHIECVTNILYTYKDEIYKTGKMV